MTKRRKITTVTLLIAMISSFAVGCGNEPAPSNDETTTPEIITTTEEPTTTQEVTTEEPTTEYQLKGWYVTVPIDKKDMFFDLTVEKGYSININDIYPQEGEDYDIYRGILAQQIAVAVFIDNYTQKLDEFYDEYWAPGANSISISYEQNAVINYNCDKRFYFYWVEDTDGKAFFDVYEVD